MFHLSSLITKTISFVHDSFKQSGITIENDEINDCEIYGYENEFSQVLINILNNSKDAILRSQKSGGSIRFKTEKNRENVTISITDNGGGAPAEIMNRLFEPYFTTKEKKEAPGIGLYMSTMIIENSMNGSIEMKSIKNGMKTSIILKVGSNA